MVLPERAICLFRDRALPPGGTGLAFSGHSTANGETYDDSELTAAHRTLQMPSLVRVTNLDNGRSVIVRVNDRGPYKRGRVMDVSGKAAELLGFKNIGTAKVRLDLLPQESMQIAAAARSGLSTKGYEVAANQGTYIVKPGSVYNEAGAYKVASAEPGPLQDYPAGAASPPVQQETVGTIQTPPSPETGVSTAIPGHTRNGQFYPDPVVTEMPVRSTGIYVQVGAFSKRENADRLSAQMKTYQTTLIELASVNGKQLYRVRLGPVATVPSADALLSRVVAGGHKEAILIVE